MTAPGIDADRTAGTVRILDRDPWWELSVVGVAVLAFGAAFAKLGQPDIPWMWPLYRLGIVLPSCGLTRGVVAIFHGDLARSWEFNPASLVVVVLAGLLAIRLGVGIFTGRWVVIDVSYRRVYAVLALILLAALWVNQQHHAQLLIHAKA